ncbi:MAG: hypothetical protein DRJ03_05850 [Chloroflexi bacterium]|nr:MAG: hypothetical protein B6I35_02355 [Anaerolineaceae bacterium 4572_32.2]RLC81761.1 MAG: hypothetical protein DRI81_01610 [Chloroflexota bacterium]RLC87486.1 MAG: hypothetical protein DRJ03_05850 [Chloroflexota bacterium]HEY74462.1 hybrid sensor histidine kinase/response regulator [Thermoflexia bacterium]
MSLAAKIREQLINSFRAELGDHVQTMTDGLLALEQDSVAGEERGAAQENIFRAAHSLKGAARAVGVTMVEQLAHALEDVLDRMQHDDIELRPELFTSCYQALDAIQAVQSAYESGELTPPPQALQALAGLESFRSGAPAALKIEQAEINTPPTDATPTPAGHEGDETIRVSVNKLDALMAQLSELVVTKIHAEQRLAQLRQSQELVALWQREWLATRSAYGRLLRLPSVGSGHTGLGKDMDRVLGYVGASQERLREMGAMISTLAREYANDTMQMSLVIDELEQEIKRIRMLPLSNITGPFRRMVRDLAREANKEAVLQIVGGDTEMDKQILEQIKNPLIHLLRNAVDHGIESPQERAVAGKPRRGAITLTAEQLGQEVVICVSDDGAGLDSEAIRQAIARRNKVGAQSLQLNKAELIEAIFNIGVSTSPIITDISGRGVGLDVVRRNVEALRGRIDVDWSPGAGSTFTLTLPLRLTSSRGLLVRVSDETFAIPLNSIEHIMQVSPQKIQPLEGRDTIRYNGRPVRLVRLNDVLMLPRASVQRDEAYIPVVILAAAERYMAFAVDELTGEQEVVVKEMGKQLTRVGGITGATVMTNGEVVLILNVADLIKLGLRSERRSIFATSAEAEPPKATRAQQHILIVDDSITTRTLEKNILEAVGYTVQLATDGQEALNNIAAEGVPDLVVSDVAMPRLNGFELTQRIKENPDTNHVPVILVTSLDSAEDKARGIEAGADAYITKSSFDQTNLLETIEQLI